MNKTEWRQHALSERRDWTANEYQRRCALVTQHLSGFLDFSGIRMLHTFLPIPGKQEADTWPIIRLIREKNPHVRIAVPRVRGDQLEHVMLEESTLETGAFGIPEPTDGQRIDSEVPDAVLVPVLIGDRSGNRIGYGKGFYDRFLVTCRPDCIKIGLSTSSPAEQLPTEPHDVTLNALVTPEGVLTFR